MEKRISKEYILNTNTSIKCKIGTTNKHNPKIVYVRTKAKILPDINKKDYSEDIKSIKKDFNNYASKLLSNSTVFDKKYIINFDLGENCLSYNKKSNIKYDVFLKPYTVKDLFNQETDVKFIIENLNNKLIELFKNKGITCN